MPVLPILQIIISVLLVTAILLQQRGQALGAAFGGGGGEFHASRRGFQLRLYYATIVLGALFVGAAVANLLL